MKVNLQLTMDKPMQEKIDQRCAEMNYTFLGTELGKPLSDHNKIILQCNIDNYIWYPTYGNFVRNGTNCPKCYGKIKKTKEELIKNIINVCLEKNFTFISFADENINSQSTFAVKCNLDGYTWTPNYNNFVVKKSGCPICGDTLLRTEESATKIINDICSKKNYSFLGFADNKYVGAKGRVNLICNHCEREWSPQYRNFVHNKSGCPICKNSKGEFEIAQYLQIKCINFVQQKTFTDCKDKHVLPFDFYITDYNICIEYDGSQHFIPKIHWGGYENLILIQKHDNIKTEYCIKNKIQLIRINYRQKIPTELDNFFN